MTQKTDALTSVSLEDEGKTDPSAVTSTQKASKKSTGQSLLATWQGTKPLLLAILDKAAENGLPVQKLNINVDGHQVACIILPTQQWTQAGKYLTLQDVP